MRRGIVFLIVLLLVLVPQVLLAETVNVIAGETEVRQQLPYRFADAEEGKALLLGNSEYFANFSPMDLDYRAHKKGATLEEVLPSYENAVHDFSDEQKAVVDRAMEFIENRLTELGAVLPSMDEIIFIMTDMSEEGGAIGYTHKNQIYLGSDFLTAFSSDERPAETPNAVVAHEVFHCLTRANDAFRQAMYGVIGFTVTGVSFKFSPDIEAMCISNPDVNLNDAYASFTINGQSRDCAIVLYTDVPYGDGEDSFLDVARTGLVPIDQLDTILNVEEAENFWEVLGRNTDYVIAAEECMADNFASAIIGNYENLPNPEIQETIIEIIRTMNFDE